jgi:peptide/nickel transport system substrate-binding protein
LLVTAACSQDRPPSDFTVGIESYPTSLDPRYPSDAYSGKVQGLIFNGLVKLDQQLALVPDLAEGFSYLSATHLRFQLRRGVRFHNGKELTARDVVYTLRTLSRPGAGSPLYGVFRKIAEVKALDDFTVEIRLKEPFAPFLTALTVGIVPEGSYERDAVDFSAHPVGTGPFKLDRRKNDQWIRLLANQDYFESPPRIGSLLIETIRDDTTRVLKLLRGEIDLVQNAVPPAMAAWLKGKKEIQMISESGINYVYLAFNLRDPVLYERRVREAMGLALNRDELIQYQLKGLARKATGILSPRNGYYEANISELNYDPELAKQLLSDAGHPDPDGDGPGKRFTIQYKTSNKRDRVAMARAIARQLEAVGIGVDVRPYEWGTFFRDIRTGNFEMYSSTWVGVTDPDIYYYAFHSQMIPPEGANRGYYLNLEVDHLLELARTETDTAVRKKYYSQVQKLISLELPYVSLWYEDNVVFMRSDVEGYELRPDASLIGLTKVRKKTGT